MTQVIEPQNTTKTGGSAIDRLLGAAIFIALTMQAYLAVTQEINWDEFFYLSKIYEYQSGTLTRALQTFHVYAFSWLPFVGDNEVRQVEAARGVMLLLHAGTAYCIYLIARNFISRSAALLAILAYVSAGTSIVHGASFRVDPIAAFLIMVSIALLTRPLLKASHLVLASIAIALGALITIKVALYAPALLTAGLWQYFRSERSFAMLIKFAAVTAAAILLFGLLYFWHQSNLPAADIDGSKTMMASAAKSTLLDFDFLPQWRYFSRELPTAFIPTILLFSGLIAALRYVVDRRQAKRDGSFKAAIILGLAAPILSFLFYRNAYPYFYPFIFPPAVVLIGYAADRLATRQVWIVALAIAMLCSAGIMTSASAKRDQQAQNETIAAVHQIFPRPVKMIDRNSMIASFPKRGLFMSRWGLKDYLDAGEPVFAGILAKEVVPLLILNSPTLEDAVGVPISEDLRIELFEDDKAVLKANFIPHWGKIWVAGKSFDLGGSSRIFEVRTPGEYRLEAKSAVMIDGKSLDDRDAVYLERGNHQIESVMPQTANLRWAAAEHRLVQNPSKKPIYRGFQPFRTSPPERIFSK